MNTFDIDFKENKWLYLYYLILHLICLSWTEMGMVAPNIIMRLLVTGAVFVPLIKYISFLPAIIILFCGIRFNSIAPFGYVPQTWNIYISMIIIITLLHYFIFHKNYFKFSFKQSLILFLILIIDFINLKFFTDFWLFTFMLFILFNIITTRRILDITIFSFVILSISLCIYYLIFAKTIAISYYGASELTRSTWVDPNYFGILIGIGPLFAFYYCVNQTKYHINIFIKSILLACYIIGVFVIISQASRGALLAIGCASIIIVLTSQIRFFYKIIFTLLTTLIVVVFFNNGVFDLLINRTLADTSSGSGRIEIWYEKLSYLINNPIYFIGKGYSASINDFPPYKLDCHNEYISTLLNYGVLGITIIIKEVFNSFFTKNNLTLTRTLLMFGLISFFTLSPFSCSTGWLSIPLMLLVLYRLQDKRF